MRTIAWPSPRKAVGSGVHHDFNKGFNILDRARVRAWLPWSLCLALLAAGAAYAGSTPWPAQYKKGGTAADVLGPDGKTWFPNWRHTGVQGGIPNVKVFAAIEKYGGKADDGADDAAALQKACDAAAAAGGGAVVLGAGTYHIDKKVLITGNGVVIRGQGWDKTKLVIRYSGNDDRIKDGVILFKGKHHVSHHPLAADGKRGDTQLKLAGARGLKAGDFLMIDVPSTDRWRKILQTKAKLVPRMGIVRIKSVAGKTVRFDQPLRIDFPVLDKARAIKMDPIQNCGVEDLYITQTGKMPKICTVLFWYAANCWGRGVKVEWTGRMPLYGSHVKWMTIKDCEFNRTHHMRGGGTGYVGWQWSSDCLMENVSSLLMRHAPNLDWATSGCVIRNSTFLSSDAQLHSGWCHENLFENIVVVNPSAYDSKYHMENGRNIGGPYGHAFLATGPEDSTHGPNGPRNVIYNCDFQNIRNRGQVFGSPDTRMYGPSAVSLGGMNENWILMYNRFHTRGAGIVFRAASFDHIIKGNIFLIHDKQSAVVVKHRDQSSGIELTNNIFYGGNSKLLDGDASVLSLNQGNKLLPAYGAIPSRAALKVPILYKKKPARPRPEVPSIYEWQQKRIARTVAGSGRKTARPKYVRGLFLRKKVAGTRRKTAQPKPPRATPAELAAARQALVSAILHRIEEGLRPRIFVVFLDRPARGILVKASQSTFEVEILANRFAYRWEEIPPRRLHGIARRCLRETDGPQSRLLARYRELAGLDE